ncbi:MULTISPECIES: dioxygenase [unclassified Streptomyces]|uniref:dioxygenase family protein n=1 Tax=unclassified Streptomyces TaxID=2593676 RepID=UPI001BB0CAA1|nr:MULTISPECIES: dioxygenase [unclassified Streptomyces]MDH6502677.1 hydroxyquinol 1,2-dioxygenase [Streptomyces sp. SAI-149]QUC59106.1 6-chlorohydroxyquinol-1,2-dioxygenase [Streptomyces sp. A2-16]
MPGTDEAVKAITAAAVDSFRDTPDPRLRELLQGLVRHLHGYVRELRPTIQEWEYAVDYLTAVGHTCDPTRQEFILLSDVLGVSMLVETVNEEGGGTESTVLGPFHVVESPQRESGDTIDLMGTGTPCVVSLRVTSADGRPLAGASVDVWQCTEDGFYDVQQPDVQPPGNGRGLFRADDEGRVWFRTVVPSHYPIPTDGPVGVLLDATERHPYRPAHIHFIVQADGHRTLTTHIFVADGPYLDSDAVFAVKESLVVDFPQVDDEEKARTYRVTAPFRLAEFDITVDPETDQDTR